MGPEGRTPAPQCACALSQDGAPCLPFLSAAGTRVRPASVLSLPPRIDCDEISPSPSEGPWSSESGPQGVSGAQFQVGEWPVAHEPPGHGQAGRFPGSHPLPAQSLPKGAERVGATPGVGKA